MPSPRHLAMPLALLAIATATCLFLHSDVNAALLWSQCHARSVLVPLSRVPLVGTPSCFLISFLDAALDSLRSKALFSVMLAFLGSLLSVSSVESARAGNAGKRVVAHPTLSWVVFVLGGGALVWQLVVVPAFVLGGSASSRRREVPLVEVFAVPLAVALGFYVPSGVMLAVGSPVCIAIWLFFPVYVSLVRRVVRFLLGGLPGLGSAVYLERRAWCVVVVYALPVLASLLAQGFIMGSLTGRDDRKEVTVSAVTFIGIDVLYVWLTVLYWVFVEVGWRAPLVMAGLAVLLGPGAGTALGWLYREKRIMLDFQVESGGEDRRSEADERTPLVE